MQSLHLRFFWYWSISLLLIPSLYSQPIVVSEYKNHSDPGVEWTELLVTEDNVDLRGYVLTDNNSGQTARQGGVRFANIPFWAHLRKGTVIVLYHRNSPQIDSNAKDGFLLLSAVDTNAGGKFEPVQYNTSFSWNDVALNIAQGGDILEILDPSGSHVYGLGHRSTPGSYFQSMPFPKLNHPGTCVSSGGIMVSPGASLSDYTGGHMTGKTIFDYDSTQGLPNNNSSNLQFWRSLRQPVWNNPQLNLQLSEDAQAVQLSWTSAVDPYPADSTQGYLIVRSQTENFPHPSDGYWYSVGSQIGSARVVAVLPSSQITSFRDSLSEQLPCGDTLFYRIYAFRYRADDIEGNGYHPARGTAYNEAAFATGMVTPTFPGNVTLSVLNSAEICEGDTAWLQASPIGNGFRYQWAKNGVFLLETTVPSVPVTTAGLYTVTAIAPNGCSETSASVQIVVKPKPQIAIQQVTDQCLNNQNFDFTATVSPSDGIQYYWFLGDDATPAFSSDPSPSGVVYATAGLKTVRLVVSRQGCWSDTAMIQFAVLNPPEVEIEMDDPLILCKGDSIQMRVSVTGSNLKFDWDPGRWFSDSTRRDPWFYATETGQFEVKVTVTDTVQDCIAEDVLRVWIFNPPEAHIAPSGTIELCEGESVVLRAFPASTGDLYEYTWLPGGARLRQITVFQPGAYRVVVKNRTTGCQDTSDWVYVVVHSLPDSFVTIRGGVPKMCAGDTIYLEAGIGQGYRYRWNTGDTTRILPVTQPGSYTVTVTTPKGCTSQSAAVEVRYWDVRFALNDALIDFGSLGECVAKKELETRIANNGQDTVHLNVQVPPSFAVIPSAFDLKPGEDRRILVQFLPVAPGVYQDTIVFRSTECNVEQKLLVQGRKEKSEIILSASSVVFPELLGCKQDSYDTTVILYNRGTATVRVDSLRVGSPFTVVSPLNFPRFLLPGDSLEIVLRFLPPSDGIYNGTAEVFYQSVECATSLHLVLTGRRASAQIVLVEQFQDIDFGSLLGCDNARDTSIAVENTGTAPAILNASTFTAAFQILTPLPDTLQPGEMRILQIRFQPPADGVYQDSLLIQELRCSEHIGIFLRGERTGTQLSLSNTTVQFDPYVLGCTERAEQVIAIRNFSTEGISGFLDSVTIEHFSGGYSYDFPASSPIPPADSLTITVRFTPATAGIWIDTLRVYLQPCNLVFTVVVTGVAVNPEIIPLTATFDFGKVLVGQTQNTTVLFENTGEVPLVVEEIRGVQPPFAVFQVLPPLPAEIAPGERIEVQIQFAPSTSGTFQSAPYLVAKVQSSEQCEITSNSVTVFGQGYFRQTMRIFLQALIAQFSAKPDEITDIPLMVTGRGIDTVGIDSCFLRITYDGNVLYPENVYTGSLTPSWNLWWQERTPGVLEIALSGIPLQDTAGSLVSLQFRPLLSPVRTTVIAVDTLVLSPTSEDVLLIIESVPGRFLLEDTCGLAPELIQTGGTIQIAIEPISRHVTIILPTDDPAAIRVYDSKGREVFVKNLSANQRRSEFSLQNLPPGFYVLQIRIGKFALYKPIPLP